MKSYALFIGIPVALLVQHLHYVTNENFENKTREMSAVLLAFFGLLAVIAWKNQWFDLMICVELITVSVGTMIGCSIMNKSSKKLRLDDYQVYEGVMGCIGIVWGIFCCVFPWTNYYNVICSPVCNSREVLCSKLLYTILGISYCFYHRFFICMIYRHLYLKKK